MAAQAEGEQQWFIDWGNGATLPYGPLTNAGYVLYNSEGGLHQFTARIPLTRFEAAPDGQWRQITDEHELTISYDSSNGVLAAELVLFPDRPPELTGSMPLHADTLTTIREVQTQLPDPAKHQTFWRSYFKTTNRNTGLNLSRQTFELAGFFQGEYPLWALTTQAVDARVLPGIDAAGIVKPLVLPNAEYGIRFGWIVRMDDLEKFFSSVAQNDPLFPVELQQSDDDSRWSWLVTHVLSRATTTLQSQYYLAHEYCRWFADERRLDLTLRLMLLGEPNAERGLLGQGIILEDTEWYRSRFDRDIHSLMYDSQDSLPSELSRETPDWFLRWMMGATGIQDATYQFVGFDPNDPTQNPLEFPQASIGWIPCAHYTAEQKTEIQQEEFRSVWHPHNKTLTMDIVLFPGGTREGGVVQQLGRHMGKFIEGYKIYMEKAQAENSSQQIAIKPRLIPQESGISDLTLGITVTLDNNRGETATQVLAALRNVFPDAEYFTAHFIEHELPKLEASS